MEKSSEEDMNMTPTIIAFIIGFILGAIIGFEITFVIMDRRKK